MTLNPMERRRAEEFSRLLDPGRSPLPHSRRSVDASGASMTELAGKDVFPELVGVTERLGEVGEQLAPATRP